ncbi:hypothetical protein C8R41DRAFT_768738 [Lentinula lateritia]|uniref:Uncharacterized protein n=1 Tax=Lentinula lateritia TaxID=40482 RepID=A0ABQ8VBK8_9AGAR|nr:hypothetical protein C8R41DRAFT_768738 [Lentinula lateritia]
MSSSVSRPITPDSPSTKTLDDLTNTIDDLTLALNNFSRVPSPEPPSLLSCCCQREDCENLKAWQAMKLRLENRLILSAEIGQALLQRHEAYVRRHEVSRALASSTMATLAAVKTVNLGLPNCSRKSTSWRRLTLVNNEVTEVSSKTLYQELQEARTMISRLSASHAKSIGWETRLSVVNRERDDMQQERDFESQRARLAESRFAALKDKTLKLQSEVRRLQDELEQKRLLRMESTESLLQNARTRIQMLHTTFGSQSTSESAEVTNVLESLVNDNEGLKRDNAELQSLLAESRDDLHALQQEVEERRADMPMKSPRSHAGTPLHANFGRSHHYSGSLSSSSMREHTPLLNRRHSSLERNGLRPLEPLTPDTLTRELPPLSPGGSDSRSTFGSRSYGPLPPSPYQIEFDGESATGLASPEKTRTHRPLFLLTRSCGVQTDDLPSNLLGLSPVPTSPAPSTSIPTPSPHDPRSETSSFSDSTTSNMGTIIERMTALFTRMSQADALTLTNRLKRQHLRGADVGHISRNTVNGIINETSTIRIHFRHLLEDEHLVTMCTRKDLRALFKLFREFFVEMGTMRVTLNDVILDPSIATRVSELALDPAKAGVEKNPNGTASSSWMAPISKLFAPSSGTRPDTTSGAERAASPSTAALSGLTRAPSNSRPPRFVPKLQPALSASATTVNVEFSSGVGRSITSSSATPAGPSRQESVVASTTDLGLSSVMGIFAGAPLSSPDPWVVVPKGPRRVQSTLYRSESPVIYRQPGIDAGLNPNFLSRNVDAVIDEQNTRLPMVDEGANGEEKDIITPLMHHKLRRRGLSDSSIHSTFTGQGDDLIPSQGTSTLPLETHWPSKGSVLQALSRKVQSFKSGITDVLPSSSYDDRRHLSGAGTGPKESRSSSRVVSKSGLSGYIPDISSWAATDSMNIADSLMAVGSPPRDESSMMRHR